MGSEGRNF